MNFWNLNFQFGTKRKNMNSNEHIVNLDLPPKERWAFLEDYKDEINELIGCYLADFIGSEFIFANVGLYKSTILLDDYLDEIEYIASISEYTADEILIANLYYDILKFYFGCTAFAVHTPKGMLHARNLDWHTDNNLLSTHSKVFKFTKGGEPICKTIGWPGFVGALSGTKPGKFSITLNAVLSTDLPELAYPISFLLRNVLTEANSFSEAKDLLEQTTIASDCLLLLSGIKEDEMVVIERTPKRFATRYSENNYIVVTNDYKTLENNTEGKSILQSTSCGRYNRAQNLINTLYPENPEACLSILKDSEVMMGITVQQMVFANANGEIKLIKT